MGSHCCAIQEGSGAHHNHYFVNSFILSSNQQAPWAHDCGLGPLSHTASLHTFKLEAHTAFLDLALFLLLRIFEVTLVTKFHQMSRLVHLTLETTKGRLDWFPVTDFHHDVHRKGSGRSACGIKRNQKLETTNEFC